MRKYLSYIFILLLIVTNLTFAKWRRLSSKEIKYLRVKIARTAENYAGKKILVSKGKKYRFDCSGLVLATMAANNITIFEKQKVRSKGANGVRIIYDTLKKYKRIYRYDDRVKIGDLIFFNNTYDKNRNRRLDDFFTHIAIVVGVDKNRTIKYVHRSSNGIEYGYMNLRFKHRYKFKGRVVNSFLREQRKFDTRNTKYYSGELFFAFGTVFK